MQSRNGMGAFQDATETFLEFPSNLDLSKGLPSKDFDEIVDYVSKNTRDIFDIDVYWQALVRRCLAG